MRRTSSLLLLAALAACADTPTSPTVPDAPAPLYAKAGGYNLVLVKSVPPRPGAAGAPVVNNLADAFARVAPGGTIRLDDGVWSAEWIDVVVPGVTVEAATGAVPVIRNEEGWVALQVRAEGLTLDGVAFENAATVWGAMSVFVRTTGSVTIRDASFRGNADAWGAVRVDGTGEITDSDFSDCGMFWCVQSNFGSLTVHASTLSNRFTGGGPVDESPGSPIPAYAFSHFVMSVTNRATLLATENVIDGCGWGQCMGAYNEGTLIAAGNDITAYEADGTRFAATASNGRGGDAGGRPGHVVFHGNTVVGVAGNADRGDNNDYAFRIAGLLVEGEGSTLLAEDNELTNAYAALLARAGGRAQGGRNRFSLLGGGMHIFDGDTHVEFRGNDFEDYLWSLAHGGATSSWLTCNWWGTPDGPQNANVWNGQGASVYTPWATSPVALHGGAEGDCTGGA